MMGLLERAGLVRREDGEFDPEATPDASDADAQYVSDVAIPVPLDEAAGVSLEQVYAAARVPQSPYPAERLLRLIDGLKAMDEPMRLQTIQAIDAADDSWTLEDPVRDALAKVTAIEAHAAAVRAGIVQAERDTQARLAALRQNQEASIAEIKRQIAELDGLLAREVSRGAQEAAAIEAAFQTQKDAATRELGTLGKVAEQLQSVVTQFNAVVTTK